MGTKRKAPKQRKITAILPEDLLESAMKSSGEGIAATLKRGLALVAAERAYDQMLRLKGKVKVSIDLDSLRTDK